MTPLMTVIIADDLTGALDSVAPFAALGLVCAVALTPDDLTKALLDAPDVLAINLGSREIGAKRAHAIAVATSLALVGRVGRDTVWFKKIDSRMKGEIAAEVAGVISVIGAGRVLICPAIPDLGRVVIDGRLSGAGVGAPIPVVLDLPGGIDVTTPDARTDKDLDRVLQGSAAGTLFVGARGLAAALARLQRPGKTPTAASMPKGPVAFCVGSRDPITVEQIAILAQADGVSCCAAPDGNVPPTAAALVQATQGAGASPEVVSARLAQAMLGRLEGVRTLVATGGETAAALLRAAGIGVLRVEGEVLPGLPLCHAAKASMFPALVTKSGGFGQPDTLLQLWLAAQCKEDHLCQ
jgi:D-threonate/D-erythronate kinase